MLISMLRPKGGFLDSSRAVHRASVRAERKKAVGNVFRGVSGLVVDLWGTVVDQVLLLVWPLACVASAYVVLDKPVRWIRGREPFDGAGFLLFAGAVAISLIGLSRVLRRAQPIAPVRPQFAQRMFAASWIAALLFTLGDLSA